MLHIFPPGEPQNTFAMLYGQVMLMYGLKTFVTCSTKKEQTRENCLNAIFAV